MRGTIRNVDGSHLPCVVVKAVDVDIRCEQSLGLTKTSADGKYEICYGRDAFSKQEFRSADLKIYVYKSSERETPLALSKTHFNAGSPAVIDVVVGGDQVKPPSEFAALRAKIIPLLGDLAFKDIVEDEKHQDISFLVGETGEDQTKLKFLALAHQLEAKTEVRPDVFYGLFRENISTDLRTLLNEETTALNHALKTAIASNIIDLIDDREMSAILSHLKSLGVRTALGSDDNLTPLGEVLGTSAAKPSLLLDTLSSHQGPIEKFWADVDTMPDFKGKVADIQLSVQLGITTLSHAPLVRELQQQHQSGALASFKDLSKFTTKDWTTIIEKPGIGAPDLIPGKTPAEKNLSYATRLSRLVEDTFPTAFIASRLHDTDDDKDHGSLHGKEDIQKFFSKNPDFEFTTKRLDSFLSSNSTALDGIVNPERFKASFLAMQRVYRIAPQYTQMRKLVAGGIGSSMQIARMGLTSFTAKFGADVGGAGAAAAIFERASNSHAMAYHLIASFGNRASLVPIGKWRDWGSILRPLVQNENGIPDWTTLFGSMDMCSCTECRSVDGPAAYLVDILHFLKDRLLVDRIQRASDGSVSHVLYKQRTLPNTEGKVDKSAKDVLFERRPDIGTIELTCQNTNTPLPYVDLVNEALENAVSPPNSFQPFQLLDDAWVQLDALQLDPLRKLFEPPLTVYAVPTVIESGERWTIDEQAYTYTILRQDGKVTVESRSLQTKGTALERAANPQYINPGAYDLLRTQIYPWTMPFDLPTQTVRTYLSHVGVGRYEVLEVFFSPDRRIVLNEPSIVQEFLTMNSFEAKIVRGEVDQQDGAASPGPWNLWGFTDENLGPTSTIPDPANNISPIVSGSWSDVVAGRVDIFLQQSGLTFPQLLNLVEILNLGGLGTSLDVHPQEKQSVGTCDPSKLQITGCSPHALSAIVRIVRLIYKLNGWSIIDLGKTFTAFGFPQSPAETDAFLSKISHVQRLKKILDLPLDFLLAFWSEIDTTLYEDHENGDEDARADSLYDQIFRNQTITNQPDEVFTRNPGDLTGKLSENSAPLTAALSISPLDLASLLAEPSIVPDNLSLDSLSKIFRHTTLAKALETSIPDYLNLLNLVSSDPFKSTLETVMFVERVQSTLLSGFSWIELNYILRHDFRDDSGISPTDEALALILDDIRSSLRTISAENTYDVNTVDGNGDLSKKKLALLNWDPSIIAQAVGVLNNTASFTTPLQETPPSTSSLPTGLQARISYDLNTNSLSYSRVMSIEDRDMLKGLPSATPAFLDAIENLFKMPRDFFARNMRTFRIHDFSADLTSFPGTITIPVSLRRKVYFDVASRKLHSAGALSVAERQTLLDLSTDPTGDVAYLKAVNDLYIAPENIVPALQDSFITTSDVGAWFDASINPSGMEVTPAIRFDTLLQKLLPYLREKLSNELIRQKVGQTINADSQIVENLMLSWLNFSSKPINEVFRAGPYVDSSQKTPMVREAFEPQFQALTLLTKVGLIINKLQLSATQLNWVFIFRKQNGDPTSAWLDLNSISLSKLEDGTAMFAAWERLYALTRLRDALVGGETLLDTIFKTSRVGTASSDAIVTLLATDLKVQELDLKFLVGPQGFNMPINGSAFQDEVSMTRIIRAVTLFKKIGCTPADGKLLTAAVLEERQARAVKQAVKSKYDQSTWDTVAKPLSNILRDAQRAALVSYLLAHPNPAASPPWRTTKDLYAYFLMDVEMGPCQKTSRIKQAISSVQLFAQRCLMNLETEVQATEEIDSFWREWTWMKSFRIAGANRQVFEKPENYLDSSVRDDKTQFFTDLESEIQQADITQATAETALLNYLEKLDQVARMQVISFYHQQESDGSGHTSVDILHVFSRTQGKPQRYFYCTRVDGAYWTSWEKVDIDIQGDHLIPVVWNRRLYLFWAVFTEKQKRVPITLPSGTSPVPDGDTYWEIKLAWTERKQAKWLPKKLSDSSLLVKKSGTAFDERDMELLPGRTLITFKAQTFPDTGELKIRALGPYPLGTFYFNGISGQPTTSRRTTSSSSVFDIISQITENITETILYSVAPVSQTRIENMGFGELDKSDNALWVRTENTEKVEVLGKTPGKFEIIIPHQDRLFQSQRPFWFQHDQRCFFVEPRDTSFWPIAVLPRPSLINPGLMNGSLAGRYWDRPIMHARPAFLPRPDIAGPTKFSNTFEFASDMNVTLKTAPAALSSLQPQSALEADILSPRLVQANCPIARASDVLGNVGAFRRIDTGRLRIPPYLISWKTKVFQFSNFYHPFVSDLIRVLNRDGIDGLYQRPLQLARNDNFSTDYNPLPRTTIKSEYPVELVDFDDNMYGVYNWELFFHVPVLIAERLSQNQKFADAQKWFHYVFDPTDMSGLPVPQRYWKTKKLFEVTGDEYVNQTIKNIFNFLAQGGDPSTRASLSADSLKYLEQLERNVARWRRDPFKPFMVARARVTAFQKSVVMKYLDNLIAWGDSLFRGDTIELINEATQIYVLAADILGPRPTELAARATPVTQSYNTLEPKLDAYSNALVAVEGLVPPQPPDRLVVPPSQHPLATTSAITYFCVPKNEKLLSYWDVVSDRLFKIRNCMNLMVGTLSALHVLPLTYYRELSGSYPSSSLPLIQPCSYGL